MSLRLTAWPKSIKRGPNVRAVPALELAARTREEKLAVRARLRKAALSGLRERDILDLPVVEPGKRSNRADE
jgi:hypothetical protein